MARVSHSVRGMRMKAPKWTDAQLALMLRTHEAGATIHEIANVHMLTPRRVQMLLRRARFLRPSLVLEQQSGASKDCLCAFCIKKKSPK